MDDRSRYCHFTHFGVPRQNLAMVSRETLVNGDGEGLRVHSESDGQEPSRHSMRSTIPETCGNPFRIVGDLPKVMDAAFNLLAPTARAFVDAQREIGAGLLRLGVFTGTGGGSRIFFSWQHLSAKNGGVVGVRWVTTGSYHFSAI
jgi:hypothetical protein